VCARRNFSVLSKLKREHPNRRHALVTVDIVTDVIDLNRRQY
jgi:hypothetical protein